MELAVRLLKLVAGVVPKSTAVGLPRDVPWMITVVPPASGAELGRTALTAAGAGAAAMSDAGVVQVPVTADRNRTSDVQTSRSLVVPVETDGAGDPVPLVKLTADPGALIGGWLATITVEGIVNVTGWVAGVAPVAVTDAFTVPERVSPLIELARVPKVNSSAKLERVNLAPAAGTVGLRDPVTTRPVSVSGTGLPATVKLAGRREGRRCRLPPGW